MNWLAVVPIVSAGLILLGTIVTVLVARKTSKETNIAQIFSAVATERQQYIDQLQEDAERYRKRAMELEDRIAQLEKEKLQDHVLIDSLRLDIEECKRLHHECRETIRRLTDIRNKARKSSE